MGKAILMDAGGVRFSRRVDDSISGTGGRGAAAARSRREYRSAWTRGGRERSGREFAGKNLS